MVLGYGNNFRIIAPWIKNKSDTGQGNKKEEGQHGQFVPRHG